MQKDCSQKLTKKQAAWLEHIRGWQASGEALSAYAARQGIPRQGIYRWKRRLQALGLLTASDGRRRGEKGAATRPSGAQRLGYVTARIAPEEAGHPSVRIHFRNGVVLEVGSSAAGLLKTDLLTQLAALP